MIDHGIRGPVVLPGDATADGVVVPVHAGASPATLGVVAIGVIGLSLGLAVLLGAVVAVLGWNAGLALGLLIPGAALGGMVRALFRPDGLRVGARDVALLRGSRVVWRRGLHEIERVELSRGGEWISLVTVSGEVRGASLGSLWEESGAAEAVYLHLAGAVEGARRGPDAEAGPDERVTTLLERAR